METEIKKFFLIFFLIVSAVLSSHGEVFWRDFFQNSGNAKFAPNYAGALLEFEQVYTESLIINGFSTELQIGNSNLTFSDLLLILNKIADAKIDTDGSSIFIRIELDENFYRKYLIVNMGEFAPPLIFQIKLPKKFNPPRLPDFFPEAGHLEKVIEYPARRAVYCTFTNITDAKTELENSSAVLLSRGFVSVGGLTFDSERRSGSNLFIKFKPQQIFFTSFDESGNGVMYYRQK